MPKLDFQITVFMCMSALLGVRTKKNTDKQNIRSFDGVKKGLVSPLNLCGYNPCMIILRTESSRGIDYVV